MGERTAAALSGRHVVVTGGASGMGLAFAHVLGDLNANVTIIDSSEDRLTTAERALAASGIDVHAVTCDVRNESLVDRAFEAAERRLGPVWGLAAAAGVLDGALTLDASASEVWERVIGVNLTGLFLTNRRAALSMFRAGHGGRIVNWSSLASSIGLRGYAAYCASKGGVEALTRALAAELGVFGIAVNAIVLGPVATAMIGIEDDQDRGRDDLPAGRVAEPAEVAALAAFMMADAGYLTGACLEFTGGLGAARGSFPFDVLPERFARLHGREIDAELLEAIHSQSHRARGGG
jgi:NAD(P)-dependent dehydrogenase (short-subunit alcohol dehydrogenase family)